MITAHLTGEKIISNEQEAISLNERSLFGERKSGKIEYPFIEALFLIQENKMLLMSGKKIISFEKTLKNATKIDKKIETKLIVYSDLRKKGCIVKSALKFGAEFRVYEKGSRPGTSHARWILYTTTEHENLNWHDFAAKNRIAHSTKKTLLIAIVDDESDVSYYEVSWIRP